MLMRYLPFLLLSGLALLLMTGGADAKERQGACVELHC